MANKKEELQAQIERYEKLAENKKKAIEEEKLARANFLKEMKAKQRELERIEKAELRKIDDNFKYLIGGIIIKYLKQYPNLFELDNAMKSFTQNYHNSGVPANERQAHLKAFRDSEKQKNENQEDK